VGYNAPRILNKLSVHNTIGEEDLGTTKKKTKLRAMASTELLATHSASFSSGLLGVNPDKSNKKDICEL
jgi:hypothetical protein